MFYILIALAVTIIILVYVISIYNGLVPLKHGISKAWANIDVLLKQRHGELPKLVEVCKQYRDFEQTTLTRVIEARAEVQHARQTHDIAALGKAEGKLQQRMTRLFAVAEAYPDLKTSQNFLQLQQRISELENALADRRELYNEAVNLNNVRIEQFPDIIVARLAGFRAHELLQFSPEETADVDIKSLFS